MTRPSTRYAFDVEAVTSTGFRSAMTSIYRWRWLAQLNRLPYVVNAVPVAGVLLLAGPVYEVRA